MRQDNRVIGAGEIWFKKEGAGDFTKIGEIQSAKISTNVEKKETFDKSSTMKKIVDMCAKSVNATITFDTRKLNKHNMAMHMLGEEETETFAIGDTLPDGTVATAETTIPVIKAGVNPLIKGAVKFIGDDDGDERPVLVCEYCVITPSGDRELIGEDYVGISFEGAVLVDDEGMLYKEYLIPVSEG